MSYHGRRWTYLGIMAALLVAGLTVLTLKAASAQTDFWARQFATSFAEDAMGVTIDDASNIYVVGQTGGVLPGQTRGGGSSDAYVVKYDGDGNELWVRQFGGVGEDSALAGAVDSIGNLYVVGQSPGELPGRLFVGGLSGAFVRKYAADGDELWSRQFGTRVSAKANGVAVDTAGNVYVAGQVEGALPGQHHFGHNDAFVRAYDSSGNELWTRQFGAQGGDFALDVAVDEEGSAYVVGWSRREVQQPGRPDGVEMIAFVRKYDQEGINIWDVRIEGSGPARANGASVDEAGNLYVGGWISGALPGQVQVGETDPFVRKYDRNGVEVWTRQFGTDDEDRAEGIDVDGDGNLYVVGWTRGRFPGQAGLGELDFYVRTDAFVTRFDSDGREQWTRQFGTKEPQLSKGVVADDSGNLYVVGQTAGRIFGETHHGTFDAFVVKFWGGGALTAVGEPASTPSAQAGDSPTPLGSPSPTEITSEAATPLPVSTATILATTPAPAVPGQPSGGGCNSVGGGSANADIGWLFLFLLGPGLVLSQLRVGSYLRTRPKLLSSWGRQC